MATDAPPPGDADHRLSLQPLLVLAGAATGFVVLIQLVGRAVLWARFDAIGLPATQAVSTQSLEVLLAVGAGALLAATGFGLAAVAALAGIDALLEPRGVQRQGRMVLLAVLELVLLAAVLHEPASWAQRLVALASGAAAGVVFWVLSHRPHPRQLMLAMFMLIAMVGGVLAFVRNAGPPARFPMVTVFLKDGSLSTGAYVALTNDSIYYAPDSFNRTYGEVTAVPRADVARFSLSKPQKFEEAGRSSPRALLAGRKVKRPYGSVAPAIARYLAAQSAEPVWKYPPVSYLESASYISRHPGVFFDPSAQPLASGRRVALENLVRGAREYSGRPVRTEGVVLRTAQLPGGADVIQATRVTMRGTDEDSAARLYCVHRGAEDVPVGATVSAEGVIVNAGTVAGDVEKPIRGVFLQAAGNACGVPPG